MLFSHLGEWLDVQKQTRDKGYGSRASCWLSWLLFIQYNDDHVSIQELFCTLAVFLYSHYSIFILKLLTCFILKPLCVQVQVILVSLKTLWYVLPCSRMRNFVHFMYCFNFHFIHLSSVRCCLPQCFVSYYHYGVLKFTLIVALKAPSGNFTHKFDFTQNWE